MASALFYSTSAGDNEVFGNHIFINQANPETDAQAFAFYIGNARGGKLYNNTILTNVTPIWVASSYGRAENTILTGNTIMKSVNSTTDFTPVRMGSLEQPDYQAVGTEFHSNDFSGLKFGVDATDQHHTYTVYWTLLIRATDKSASAVSDRKVEIFDRNNKMILSEKTDGHGLLKVELPEYHVDGNAKIMNSPYKVVAGDKKMNVDLNKNCEIEMILK
jgi:hypothetical protein